MTIQDIKDSITKYEQEQGFYESVWALVMEAFKVGTDTTKELTVDDEIYILGGLAERRNNAISSQRYYTKQLAERLEKEKITIPVTIGKPVCSHE